MTRDSVEHANSLRITRRRALQMLGASAAAVGGASILEAYTPASPSAPAASSPAAAAPTPSSRQLRIGIAGSPVSLDFHTQTARQPVLIGSHIWEPLFAYNSKYEPVPVLLEASELASDKTTYTWRIRRGVKFHNGKEMTSEDVEASIMRWKEVSPARSALATLSGIDRPDAYTVRVKLSAPRGALLNDLAQFTSPLVVFPKEVTSAKANELKEYVGTGPYRFKEWQSDQYVLLERFEQYAPRSEAASGWAGTKQPLLKELKFQNVAEGSVRASALEAGDIEFADSLALDDHARLSRNANLNMVIVKPGVWLALQINHGRPPFNNLKARQALQAALDMEQVLLGAAGNPAFFAVDPSIVYKETVYASTAGSQLYNQKNVAKAKTLLAESGYNKQPITLLASRSFPSLFGSGPIIKSQLEQAGFVVNLESPDFPAIVQRRANPDQWNLLMNLWGTAMDPSAFAVGWHSAAKSYRLYSSSAMDKAIDATAAATTFEERKKAADEIQRVLYEEVTEIKIGDVYELVGLRSGVEGYRNFKFPTFWGVSMK